MPTRRRIGLMVVLLVGAIPCAWAQKPNSAASKAAAAQAAGGSRIKVGVTDSAWDDIGSVLRAINVPYQYTAMSARPLVDFNCLFVGCGTSELGKLPAKEVRQFVERGGVLYASDLAFPVVQDAFPEFVQNFRQDGQPGVYDCTVLDKKLAQEIAPQIKLNFDAGGWASPVQVSEKTEVLVAMPRPGGRIPVLITFKFGRGRVVYTSFHNHANANALEQKLIRLLVESPITAARQIQGELRSGADVNELQKLADASAPPPPKISPQRAAELSVDQLIGALKGNDVAIQELILQQLHDRKGGEATLGLGQAVGLVDESLRQKARDLLVKRMERLTARSLAGYITADVDMEIRVAAAKAAATKDDAELTATLVEVLQDVKQQELADAAHATLAKTSRQNFGPFVGARLDQRFVTAGKWKKWLEAQR